MKKMWKVLRESFMLKAALFVMFALLTVGRSVQAEEIYKIPFSTKYDITYDKFIIEFFLETDEDLYLAAHIGNNWMSLRKDAFKYITVTGAKSVTMELEDEYTVVYLFVVDKEGNLVADAYPICGEDLLTDSWEIYFMFRHDSGRYFWDKMVSDSVEFINGDDLCDVSFSNEMEKGVLTINHSDLPYYSLSGKSELYLNGQPNGGWSFSMQKSKPVSLDYTAQIEESGVYTFVYWLKGIGVRSKNQFVESVYVYEKPEEKISPVSNIKWNQDEFGKISFTVTEPNKTNSYTLYLQYKDESETDYRTIFAPILYNEDILDECDGNVYTYDFSDHMYYENVAYRVKIRSYSSDIEKYTHSDWAYSDVYDLATEAKKQEIRAFVERMYTVALGRGAEEEGVDWWTNELLNGTSDGAGLAQGFLCGTEFASKGYSNEEYVAVLYNTFFNREVGEGEADFWINTLNEGTTRVSVLAGFVNSEEFFNLCAEYDILRGVMLEDGVAVNAGIGKFAERLYTEVFGREGEESGMEYWATSISKGECTPKDAAISFFTSEEYLNKKTKNGEYIEALYRTFMGRDSDEEGKRFWLSSMAAGNDDRASALSNFAASEEFKGIMASYGL